MAAPAPADIHSILEALKTHPASSSAYQQPSLPAPTSSYTPPQASYQPPHHAAPYAAQPAPYQQPAAYAYPQPSATGNIDLSAIRPVNSGTVSLEQAIEQARRFAADKGVTPYDRSAAYATNDARGNDGHTYGRSRSRSPQPRREPFRDNFNPYRDERRAEYGAQNSGYSRDRSFSPRGRQGFSPRGNATRERSPMRPKDDNNEIMQIESNLVGLIIGRQGENLRRIEGDTQCRVQFIPSTGPNEPYRSCRITGPPARRLEARNAINRIVQDSGMGSGPRPGGPRDNARQNASPQQDVSDEEATLQIMVPDRTVGLIIGRGGETIRDLQERSTCHINIVGENKSVNGLRPVNLIGSQEAARMAKDLIMEIVDSDSRNVNSQSGGAGGGGGGGGGVGGGGGGGRPGRRDNMQDGYGGGGDKMSDAIYVPSEAVGMIIGKGGETIREMQNNTGCKINVSQSSGPGEAEREIGLVGSRDSIARAKQAIEEKVDAVRHKNSGGGGGRGRGQYRDHDNSSYGQPSNHGAAQGMPPAVAAPGAGDANDPYAAYGGYNAYVAMWYQALAAQQGQAQGNASQPPGTS